MKKIYFGGDIITMKNEEDRPEAVIVENGKIIYVGNLSEAETLCGMQAERIHLKGKTLMPAFIDSHSHFSQVAQNILMCDLSGAKSFEDIYRMLKAYMEKNEIGEKEVVFGVGYDHNFLAEETHPDITLLDRVSKETPIYISHVSGHMGVANSAMLWLAKVNADAPDPDGGRFGRTEDGSLNGYVEEIPALMPIIMAAMPRIKTDMERQMQLAQETYLKHGITTIQEGAAMGAGVTELVKYASSGKLKLDIVVYIMENEYKQDIAALEKYNKKYENGLKIGGAKIILDGSPQGKSAWMSRPYEGESEYRGYPSHDDAYVEKAAFHAVKGGYQLLAHCNGDAASEQFLNAYEKALRETENPDMDLRPVMIHCQTVREDQLDRMKDIGMIPSIFVGHTYYWGDVHLKNLGAERAANISPVRSALERGLMYNFHQDSPVTKPDMLHSVWCAVNRITKNGRPIGKDQCIGVFDALKGVTANAAFEYREEDSKGTLEPGKLADMVILDGNPLKVGKEKIKDIKVLETIKGGATCFFLKPS